VGGAWGLYLADVPAARAMVVWVGAIDSRVKMPGLRRRRREWCPLRAQRASPDEWHNLRARARRHRVKHALEGESELVAREEILGGRQGLWPLARRV